ncbi:unnamed protein product [Coregonus sp. 'balchen']|nr:unnamed protein product [Coregonus sp. 'balchen']
MPASYLQTRPDEAYCTIPLPQPSFRPAQTSPTVPSPSPPPGGSTSRQTELSTGCERSNWPSPHQRNE